jgi:amino acid adenylation domain-containing protein
MNGVPLLHDYLSESARRLPEKVALVARERRLTYAELDARANALAHALVRRGVARGDRVVVFADNDVETVIAFWAVLKANAVVSVVSPLTKADKLAYMLNDCRAVAMVAQASHASTFTEAMLLSPCCRTVVVAGRFDAPRASSVPRREGVTVLGWDEALAGMPTEAPPRSVSIDVDLASIIYTSGSTGEPKGVMLTHRNMLTAATSITTYLGNVEDDVILSALPLSFDYGLYQMIMACRMGARLVLERSFAFPVQLLELVAAERVTGFPGVPTMFAILGEMKDLSRFDLSSIRYVTNTAAALSEKNIRMLQRTFPKARIFSMYGLTECKRCTYLPPEDLDRKPLSVGLAIPNTELWIVDDDGNRVGPGVVGQLVIRGATVMRGYWEKPEATAKKLRPGPIPGELVLYTGDYCRLDEEGYLFFVGRMDDVIKCRGEKVAPKAIERVLEELPGVKECAVIGVPDEILGEAPKAFVVLERGAELSERELRNECARRLEAFMVPKIFALVDELPKTTTGKIKKTGLA